ncbi:DUF5700 domain-containing putative Zn-dependent protease [Aureivirga sp. CE67]|uniref:DUF5700 domain-containing putative Zn-dependent protease n=1 Tax=Aureivirga sp. CE67 TaxID=1788983 RepID=UPI0018C962C5|nr:DUF5700 domain-containing putative Zn-dependent protease [Aureivirga sp. CE67]
MKTNLKVFSLLLLLISCTNAKKSTTNNSKEKNDYVTKIKLCVKDDKITSDWKNALKGRHSEEFIDSLSKNKIALSEEEKEWYKLIDSKSSKWNQMKDSLKVPFETIYINDTTNVFLGYQGYDDAFTIGYNTVCLNLTALVREYGSAKTAKNKERIDRFFAHEYTHLLSNEWAKQTGQKLETYQDTIYWQCMFEGLGMYRSMSDKWFPEGDSLSTVADKTFETLYPIFAERITTIETSENLTEEEKWKLRRNLSRGPMKKKWGALPVGVWLAMEAKGDDRNLIPWIKMGPDALIPLAEKYLKGESKKKFDAVFPDGLTNSKK